MSKAIHTFLMFQGNAEEAMDFYSETFQDVEIVEKHKHEIPEMGEALQAKMVIKGEEYMVFDSPIPHDFDFTPSISLYVHCQSEEEIDELYAKLSDRAQVLMPIGEYPFSSKFAWVQDRFGVSWQLDLGQE
ncbi:VOC family protein [Alkalibacillus silvisoli]|uniref:VOC family protein n=1 Tax=Alkalibacillus silvisoli TaxID=392823 RepID=A0ABP3K4A4_9BACI